MAETWVADSSVLISLGRAGRLDLLEALPFELLIPTAVVDEILAGPVDPAFRALAGGWGIRREVAVPQKVAEWGLGAGESAVVALALEQGATAILDDRYARRCAKALGVPLIGTLGVVLRAKNRGLIAAAAPVIRSVVQAGLYIDEEAVRSLLEKAGEAWP